MEKQIIHTDAAPKAIGNYSRAVRVHRTVYLSGQIPLEPGTMQMAEGIEAQVNQVFRNLQALVAAAGGTMSDIVKLNVYLTDLVNFNLVNDVMTLYFTAP